MKKKKKKVCPCKGSFTSILAYQKVLYIIYVINFEPVQLDNRLEYICEHTQVFGLSHYVIHIYRTNIPGLCLMVLERRLLLLKSQISATLLLNFNKFSTKLVLIVLSNCVCVFLELVMTNS